MTDVIIDESKLSEAKQCARNIENSVKRTAQYCETLISTFIRKLPRINKKEIMVKLYQVTIYYILKV